MNNLHGSAQLINDSIRLCAVICVHFIHALIITGNKLESLDMQS